METIGAIHSDNDQTEQNDNPNIVNDQPVVVYNKKRYNEEKGKIDESSDNQENQKNDSPKKRNKIRVKKVRQIKRKIGQHKVRVKKDKPISKSAEEEKAKKEHKVVRKPKLYTMENEKHQVKEVKPSQQEEQLIQTKLYKEKAKMIKERLEEELKIAEERRKEEARIGEERRQEEARIANERYSQEAKLFDKLIELTINISSKCKENIKEEHESIQPSEKFVHKEKQLFTNYAILFFIIALILILKK